MVPGTAALGVLAVWRVTHLLHAEAGPWDIVIRLRRQAGTGLAGAILDCFYCLSLWVSAPVSVLIVDGWRRWVLVWLALSGGAIVLERVTAGAIAGPPTFREDAEPSQGSV
jgi:hypothetical protein